METRVLLQIMKSFSIYYIWRIISWTVFRRKCNIKKLCLSNFHSNSKIDIENLLRCWRKKRFSNRESNLNEKLQVFNGRCCLKILTYLCTLFTKNIHAWKNKRVLKVVMLTRMKYSFNFTVSFYINIFTFFHNSKHIS